MNTLTHIDCSFFRGQDASLDTSSYVALNPRSQPGSVVLAGAVAARGNIGGQVACRLSLQHFVEGVEDYFQSRKMAAAGDSSAPLEAREFSLEILEAGFKRANDSVYSFGHKLAAGGRLAASLLGIVVEDNLIAAGRVGQGSAYLFRQGSLFPFFVKGDAGSGNGQPAESFVGSNSLVSVELASVPLQASDLVLLFSSEFSPGIEKDLTGMLNNSDLESGNLCARLVSRVCRAPQEMAFAMLARFGPDSIFLSDALI